MLQQNEQDRDLRSGVSGLKALTDLDEAEIPHLLQASKLGNHCCQVYRLLRSGNCNSCLLRLKSVPGAPTCSSPMQVPITCTDCKLNIARAGIWCPTEKQVECKGTCCEGKPEHERIMRCSGRNSFEAHCSKSPNSHSWRQTFKVTKKGRAFVSGLVAWMHAATTSTMSIVRQAARQHSMTAVRVYRIVHATADTMK